MARATIKKHVTKNSSKKRTNRSSNNKFSKNNGGLFNLFSKKSWMIIGLVFFLLIIVVFSIFLFQGDGTSVGQAVGTETSSRVYLSDLDSGAPVYFSYKDNTPEIFKIQETNVNTGEFEISYVYDSTIFKTDKLLDGNVYCSFRGTTPYGGPSFTCSDEPCLLGIQSGELNQRCLVIQPFSKYIQLSVASREASWKDFSNTWEMKFPSAKIQSTGQLYNEYAATLRYLNPEMDAKNLMEAGTCSSILNVGSVYRPGATYGTIHGQSICREYSDLGSNAFGNEKCHKKEDAYKITPLNSDFFDLHRDALCMPFGNDPYSNTKTDLLGWVECDASKNIASFNPKTNQKLVAGPGILSEDQNLKVHLGVSNIQFKNDVKELEPSKKASEDLAQHFLCAKGYKGDSKYSQEGGRSTWHVCLSPVYTGSGSDTKILNPKLAMEKINKRGFGYYMPEDSTTVPLAGIKYTCTKNGWVNKAALDQAASDKVASDKVASDKAASDKAASD
ncbi:hypothetical protein HOD05_02285, partial [Candidatus Woesearchaeota archaeon]|nr:hypothetical protein [Candidatus Woesearchaeota archaeon]